MNDVDKVSLSTISSFTSDHPSKIKVYSLSPLKEEIETYHESTSIFYNKNLKQFFLKFKFQEKYAKDLKKWLKKNGKSGVVTIKLNSGNKIKISSMLLKKQSNRFDRLIKSYTEDLLVDGSNLDEVSFEKIVKFLNTGKMVFNINELPELLRISNTLEMLNIVTIIESALLLHFPYCINLLIDALNMSSNPLTLLQTSMKWHISNVANCYLTDLIIDNHFYNLSPAAIISILSNDKLKVSSEFDVLKLCMIYILKGDKFFHADSLFNCIRFANLSIQEIENMESEIEKYDEEYLTAIFKNYTTRSSQYDGENLFRNFNLLPPRGNCDVNIYDNISQLIDEVYIKIKNEFLKEKLNGCGGDDDNINEKFKSFTLSLIVPKNKTKKN
ncbi:BTB/POZ fold domain and BTB/Kelch-associated domain-containing protein [Strongyloides ratti]|uniref:BTB/POZ fold domain and BTB/Kelch-associated domain-containing protein n=1 Tax=Strongyloides ratti TaxID=34506 RepID=A0A090L227_STRRB|nr:BTB/POZ fold domain and BTB/Kelch-associated domain-containing protein [Strongyloides ratti]CEF62157.1 BTB/POZ fold domain and BTB/Kelch-associated domain-containing protein [Strongyloides ratti]